MDRTGESWSGDDVADAAQGAGADSDPLNNRADDRPASEDRAPDARRVATAAAESVKMNDGAPGSDSTGGAD